MDVSVTKHLTVALDGSPASEAAARYARELAARSDIALEFCHPEQHKSHAREADAIAACAREHGSVAIVIGNDARKGLAHWGGSVAESLMRIAERPVLFIRETDEFRGGDIAVTIGAYDESHQVLDAAIAIALTLDRELFLISEITTPEGVDYYRPGTNSNVHLTRAAERASAAGVMSDSTLGDGVGSIPQSLIELAKRRDCAMIVTGFHDRSAIARFFEGSIAQEIMLDSHVPVAVVHHAFQPSPA